MTSSETGAGRAAGKASAVLLLAMAAASFLALPAPAAAQNEGPAPSPPGPRPWCFVADVAASCRSFPILEVQGVLALSSSELERPLGPPRPAFEGWTLEFNLGHAFNLADRWAVGGFVTFGTGTGGYDGARGRLRYWVSPDLSLEADVGVLRTNFSSFAPVSSGPSVALRANLHDVVVAFVRYDRAELPAFEAWTPQTHSALSGGVGVAGPTAIAASGLIGIGVGVAMLLFIAAGAS